MYMLLSFFFSAIASAAAAAVATLHDENVSLPSNMRTPSKIAIEYARIFRLHFSAHNFCAPPQ